MGSRCKKRDIKPDDKFNRWTFICEVPPPAEAKGPKRRWGKFRCECTNEKIVLVESVTRNLSKSCGKCRKGRTAKRRDYKENDKVGHLIYIHEVDPYVWEGRTYRKAKFRCECGNTLECQIANAVSGNTKGCGECKISKPTMRPSGEAAAYDLYLSYEWGAERRETTFDLSFDDFLRLTVARCNYCDCVPATVHRQEKDGEKRRFNGSYTFNGIDRVNNDEGYCVGNCVTCCKTCNYAKSQMTESEFLEWVRRVAQNRTFGKAYSPEEYLAAYSHLCEPDALLRLVERANSKRYGGVSDQRRP